MKTIGIIGGFGPEATAKFYTLLTSKARASILVRHVFVPRKLEHEALVEGKHLEKFKPLLISAAKELENNGADVIVLPCNTLHVHENAIQKSIRIPFVSIIEATSKHLRTNHVKRVGLLGSRITIQNNLFKKNNPHIQFVTVSKPLQRKIDAGLDEFVASNNDVNLRIALAASFREICKKQSDTILLACTDFHGLCPTSKNVHDTLDILVRATINML